jgi:protein-tyrosine phosphatase
MIDLHIHCLPGVDDGPRDLLEATRLCRAAASSGCETLIATPHQRTAWWWNGTPDRLEEKRESLQAAIGGQPEILLGGEIRIDEAILEALARPDLDGILPLAGSSYLLLEYDRFGMIMDPEGLVHELTIGGWTPIFAHPEFIPGLGDDLDLMRNLADMGALFQVTAMSLTGAFGRNIRKQVETMLNVDLVHFVASDAHDTSSRPPGLDEAHEAITAGWGVEVADNLTSVHPLAVVENRPLTSVAETLT